MDGKGHREVAYSLLCEKKFEKLRARDRNNMCPAISADSRKEKREREREKQDDSIHIK